ncbi:MAG: hypothetical protein M1114_04385 [Candidatus Dependentiae bacterium]|nr:hypothetical protein [Candidatus Dependentiae bacterium]
MKRMIFALCIVPSIVNGMQESHTQQLSQFPQHSYVSLLSNYEAAHQAITSRDISRLERLMPQLTEIEQNNLSLYAEAELKKATPNSKLIVKNGLRCVLGMSLISTSVLGLILNYASNKIYTECDKECTPIVQGLSIRNSDALCNRVCSTLSQDNLHALTIPASTITFSTGSALSVYSFYSLFKEWNGEKKLRTIIISLQKNSRNFSDDGLTQSTANFTESDDTESDEQV